MSKKRFIEIPLNRLTRQQINNIWFSRPICFMDNTCNEETCRAFQKENKGLDAICYIEVYGLV